MRNNKNTDFWTGFGFALFTLLAVVAVVISIITFQYKEFAQDQILLNFLAINHLWIMLITMFISIIYGFSWAYFLQRRVKEEKSTTKNIFDIVLSFLGIEEQNVIKHLVEHQGKSTQANISKVQDMGAVKALRTVQKMSGKNLVEVQKEGKVRKVILKKKILELVKNSNP